MALIRAKHTRTIPSPEQMAKELIAAGWSTWDQTITVWLTPDGTTMFGTKSAWEIMVRERGRKFDS